MIYPQLYFLSSLSVAGITVFSYLIYRKLESQDEVAMTSFQLNKDKVIQDFETIALTGLTVLTGGVIYFLAGVMNSAFLKNVGYVFGLLTTVILLIVFIRWWRRF